MSERAPYSRVYWELADDPKFETIYENNDHLATWLRLLLIADQAHPAAAHLPSTAKRASITALADVVLIDLLPGSRYRIHGLEAERGRRREAATNRTGTKRGPNGSGVKPGPDPTAFSTRGLSRDEPRQDETSRVGADETTGYPTGETDALDVYHELTGYRPWGIWSGDAIRGLIGEYTDATVQATMRTEFTANGERKDLLDRLQARLARNAERAKREKPSIPRLLKPVIDNDLLQAERKRLAGLS